MIISFSYFLSKGFLPKKTVDFLSVKVYYFCMFTEYYSEYLIRNTLWIPDKRGTDKMFEETLKCFDLYRDEKLTPKEKRFFERTIRRLHQKIIKKQPIYKRREKNGK